MHNTTDRSLKILLALLTVGVWGLLLRPLFIHAPAQAQGPQPLQVGRYAIANGGNGSFFVLDTATGTLKSTDFIGTRIDTWDKDYQHGTRVPRPAENK